MKIKRFVAANIRDAIRQVREAQGPDAVILSNRPVAGGVEIVAAVDYDEVLVQDLASPFPHAPAAPASTPQPAATTVAATVAPQPASIPQPAPAVAAKPVPAKSRTAVPPRAAASPHTKVLWSQDPAIVEMRHELEDMRGLLEHQLSGLAWADLSRRHPRRTRLLRLLLEAGFNPSLAEKVAQTIPESVGVDKARRLALGLLAHHLPVTDDDILTQGGVVALVGPTGVGKTTSVAKLAARFALRHGSEQVALISTDSYRIGAHEQLRTYAQLMDVPVRDVRDAAELHATLQSFSNRRLVLIDTAGMSQRDMRLTEQLAMIQRGSQSVKAYLVLAATTQMQALAETVTAFAGVRLHGCVLTKLDEASSLGAAISVMIDHRLPVAYTSDGQRVPEDIHPARAHSLISRSIAISRQVQRKQPLTDDARLASIEAEQIGAAINQNGALGNETMAMVFGKGAARVRA